MIYTKENLKIRLNKLSHEELVNLVADVYWRCPQSESIINKAAVTTDDASDVLANIGNYSAGECKTALQKYIKTLNNRKDKALYYFTFINKVLDQKDQLDYRFISVASAAFGKAMDILGKDKALWAELKEQAYNIACRFRDAGSGEVCWRAVDYYNRIVRQYSEV